MLLTKLALAFGEGGGGEGEGERGREGMNVANKRCEYVIPRTHVFVCSVYRGPHIS